MTDYDLLQIHRFLMNQNVDLENRITDLKNKYSIFRDFDCLDLLELQELKFNLEYQRNFEQKLLGLCYHLNQFNKE